MSKGNRARRKEAGLLPSGQLCTAHSSRTGKPCQRPPVKGTNVCWHHGGGSPQVVAAAKRRLMMQSDRMGALLMQIAEDESMPPAVRLAAIRDVLDRAGVTAKTEVEVTVAPWQQIVDGIVAEVDAEFIRPQGALLSNAFADVVDGELVAASPTSQALVPAEPRIPSRRKKKGANWS